MKKFQFSKSFNDKASAFRNNYDVIRNAILIELTAALIEAEDNEIELKDNRGSLVYGGDDPESQVILSIWLQYPNNIIARVGVFEEDYQVHVKEMNIEMILNIMDAVAVVMKENAEDE